MRDCARARAGGQDWKAGRRQQQGNAEAARQHRKPPPLRPPPLPSPVRAGAAGRYPARSRDAQRLPAAVRDLPVRVADDLPAPGGGGDGPGADTGTQGGARTRTRCTVCLHILCMQSTGPFPCLCGVCMNRRHPQEAESGCWSGTKLLAGGPLAPGSFHTRQQRAVWEPGA